MKILIADDDRDSRLVLQKCLESAGHQVEAAANGDDALVRAKKSPPDLIISDILMPVLDGYKLCYEVKNDPALKRIPFVFYTATYIDPDDERLAMGLGASRYILKPVEPLEFLRLIDEVVKEAQQRNFAVPEGVQEDQLSLFRQYDASLSRKLQEKIKELGLYRMVFDNSTEAVAIVDNAGLMLRHNKAQGLMLGYSAEEFSGSSPYRYLDEGTAILIRGALAHNLIVEGEGTALAKDGRRLAVEYAIFPIRDEFDNISAQVWMLRDISKRRAAERQQHLVRTLLDYSNDAIFVIEPDTGRIIDVNQRACLRLKYTREELLQKCVADIDPFFTDKEKWREHAAEMKTAGTSMFESVHRRADGVEFPVEISLVYSETEDGDYLMATVRDITERKGLTAQLLQSQKMEAIGKLVGGVAHDFNNLLSIILGYVEMALYKLPSTDTLEQDLRQVAGAAKRAANLVRQLLLFSRQQPSRFVRFSLPNALAELLKMLNRIIGEDIRLELDCPEDCWEIEADSGNLDQVIMNLAVNARDAMPTGGALSIKTENISIDHEYCQRHTEARPGNFVRLSVSDTGKGIAPEIIPHIFEPFFTTQEMGKGTGLGLAVVYGIVKNHKGWINVYSEAGHGTVFRLFFPAAEVKEGEKEGVVPGQDGKAVSGRGERILLVEDDAAIRELERAALEGAGFRTTEAGSAEEALEIFLSAGDDFALVMSDVVLPGLSGIELIERLQAIRPGLAVLLASGYADHKSHWPLIRDRGYQFLEKPFTLVRLLEAVDKALGR